MTLETIVEKLAIAQPLDFDEKAELLAFLQSFSSTDVLFRNETRPMVDALYRRGPLEMTPRIYAGGFIAGDPTTADPDFENTNYTGAWLIYPGPLIDGEYYRLGSMEGGVLQVGISATDGKLYFGAGAGVLSVTGITLRAETYPAASYLQWLADDTDALTGKITMDYGGAAVNTGLRITARAHDSSVRGYVQLAAEDDGGNLKATFNVDQNGTATLDLTSVNGAAGVQALQVKTNITNTNALNTLLYLDTNSSGTPAAGLGSAIDFRAENSAGTMKSLGYFGAEYIDVTNGSEDSRLVIGKYVAGALENGKLDWGSWTPTATNGTNVQASTPGLCHYIRVGNEVIFHGSIQVDTTAAGAFDLLITIPIASAFNAGTDASGNGTQPGALVPDIISIREDQATGKLRLDGYAQVATNLFYRLSGGYVIK